LGDSEPSLHAGDVCRLVSLGALEKIEFHGLTFVQGTVSVLLDGGIVDKNVFSGRALNEAVTLGSIKPLHCTFFSHNILLSPLQ